ncbi:MAG TPA: pentapeptide repeat-containing protein, partial [Candidatus Gracilibacteria bacterium]|nr:pentapeptide repeat-containing protein [Candidatus Gracilibacteria bacterium]
MLRFCDTNTKLVKKVDKLFKKYDYQNRYFGELKAICGDIFEEQKQNGGTICTASNPEFKMGGGLDFAIRQRFEIDNPKEFKKDGNLFYLITVDENYKSSEKIIQRALCGVFGFRKYNLILTGIGTGIGGLSDNDFLELLEKILEADMSGANMSRANMSGANMRGANMSEADMCEADMSGADMSGAD